MTLTIATAEPSVAPSPMVRHVVEKDEHGNRKDRAVCGYLWDRPLPMTPGPICSECAAELRRRHP